MTNQRKWQLAAGLFLVWMVLAVFQYTEQSGSPTKPGDYQVEPALEGFSQQKSKPSLTLSKTFENPRQTVRFSKPRNIFAPWYMEKPKITPPPKTPATPKKDFTTPKPVKPPPMVPRGPSPAELAAQRARQKLNQYRFLGFLTKGGESQAFLTNGQAIYIVKQGETVEGRIHVRTIDPTTVVLSMRVLETGLDVQATIPLTKNQQG